MGPERVVGLLMHRTTERRTNKSRKKRNVGRQGSHGVRWGVDERQTGKGGDVRWGVDGKQ